MRVRISRSADRQLSEIVRWGNEKFGRAAAISYYTGMMELFDLLATAPQMSVEIRNGVRAHPYRSHVVVYRLRGDVEILYIFHGRSNWRRHL